jgi:hypothetical protein
MANENGNAIRFIDSVLSHCAGLAPATRRESQQQTTKDIPQHRDVERVGHRIVVLLKSDRVKAKDEKTRSAAPAIQTKAAKSEEKSERASALEEFDRQPKRKMEPTHQRDPERISAGTDDAIQA